MQLINNSNGRISAALCLVTANLFSTTGLHAQGTDLYNPPVTYNSPVTENAFDQSASEPGTTTIDSAILFYQEKGGRVLAIEPMISYTENTENGDIFSLKLTADTLSGASPFGAAPWKNSQKFLSPTKAGAAISGDDENGLSSTGASGGTIITDPTTGMKLVQTTVKPYKLPLNPGFQDKRGAVDLGYTTSLSSRSRLSLNLNGSIEGDYRSFSGGASFAQDFNNKTTTVSLGMNYEHDISKRFYGTPTPLSIMTGIFTDGSKPKNVISLTAGVTQVMTRNWLLQFNYSYESVKGYQTDPYKIISVVDPITGAPQKYLYESRPDKRTRQAFYIGSKLAIGSYVTNLSARYYHDTWGINSITAIASEHIPVGERGFIEPGVRYYHQSSANFFSYYLLSNQAIPQFTSADYRLDSFKALTVSINGGYMMTDQIELYAMVEGYVQKKSGAKGLLPGDNGTLKLFAGVNALSVMTGFKYKF